MTITAAQRRLVRNRANNCCKYCRMPESAGTLSFHVDHIIPVKHSGTDDVDNLCFACYKCNGHKGNLTRLYHPRLQPWNEHFEIQPDMRLAGRTPEGRTTVYVLRVNNDDRVENRRLLAELEEYPC